MKATSRLSVDDNSISDPENRPGSGIKLLDGETVLERITPHYLAFYRLYILWAYIGALSILFIVFFDTLLDVLRWPISIVTDLFRQRVFDMGLLSGASVLDWIPAVMNTIFGQLLYFMSSNEYVIAFLWLAPIILFSTVFSVLRIEWKWIAVMTGVGLASIALTVLLDLPGVAVYYIALAFSVLGCVGVEYFRRCHTFYVTNYRIITELKFIGLNQNTLSYDKINNLIVEQSLIGRIFNFGTVIPITASGLGMGEDSASVSVGAGGRVGKGGFAGAAITGGRSVEVPRTRSQYALFGVTNPKRVYNTLSKFMQEYVEAPYLKDMRAGILKMLEHQEKMLEEKKK